MLAINMDDVMKVLDMIKVHLIVLGVILVLAIAAMVACGKMSKGKKFLVRSQAALALFLAVVIVQSPRASAGAAASSPPALPQPRRPLPPYREAPDSWRS